MTASWNSEEQNQRTPRPLPHFADEESETRRANEFQGQAASEQVQLKLESGHLLSHPGFLQLLRTVSNPCLWAYRER